MGGGAGAGSAPSQSVAPARCAQTHRVGRGAWNGNACGGKSINRSSYCPPCFVFCFVALLGCKRKKPFVVYVGGRQGLCYSVIMSLLDRKSSQGSLQIRIDGNSPSRHVSV